MASATTNGFNPFLFYSAQLQNLLTKAAKQKDPALWLYKNGARSTLFMLESLTRLHKNAFEEKLFEKWNKRFKKLEDVLGQIDDYDALEKTFKSNKKVSKEVIKYYTVHKENYLEKLNRRLATKDWLNEKVLSFDQKLNEFEVTYDEHYISELRIAMEDEIDEILYFTLKSDYRFTKIEEQVHEIRRKLRWLSIYVQALRGLIQLKKSGKRKKFAINYFTKDILNSPYNKVIAKPKNAAIVEFDSDSFFALSWIISELGKQKDILLNLYQLRDAIYVTEELNKEDATKKAIAIMGLKATVEEDVLKEASRLIEIFIAKDKMLDHLIVK
ncbi:MAG: hypothetical protein V4506_06325 [Bacteroidota bacterium]